MSTSAPKMVPTSFSVYPHPRGELHCQNSLPCACAIGGTSAGSASVTCTNGMSVCDTREDTGETSACGKNVHGTSETSISGTSETSAIRSPMVPARRAPMSSARRAPVASARRAPVASARRAPVPSVRRAPVVSMMRAPVAPARRGRQRDERQRPQRLRHQ